MSEYENVNLEEYYLSFGLKKKSNGEYEVDKKINYKLNMKELGIIGILKSVNIGLV